MRRIFAFLIIGLLTMVLTIACTDHKTIVARDKQQYSLISAERKPGEPCHDKDSASIQRRRSHPAGPGGGWYQPTATIDPTRQSDRANNEFAPIGGDLAGYLKFDTPGRLQMRAYDDVYGDVYCGWSPASARYKPQSQAAYGIFSDCSVGDGGLDQVNELCWFPEDTDIGTVVYSSAYPQSTQLQPYDLYLPRHIGQLVNGSDGQKYYFNDHVADQVFDSLLIAGRLSEAQQRLDMVLDNFPYLASVIDGTTKRPIPSEQYYCEEWANHLLLDAGLSLFEQERAIASIARAKTILANGKPYCSRVSFDDLIDFYQWTIERANGRDVAMPDVNTTVGGRYSPYTISNILSNPQLTDTTWGKEGLIFSLKPKYFWLGLREYLADNMDEASRYLNLYTESKANDVFELAAAASLKAHIRQ